MLTAKGDDIDHILGLEMGADDYLAKPFNSRELLARIKAVLRRTPVTPQQQTKALPRFIGFAGWRLDTGNRMQRRLTRLIEGRTELLAAISHDLRTPITQMRLRTELMPASVERDKTLAALDEMEAIIATFLDYARAANETEERSRSNIGALVESLSRRPRGHPHRARQSNLPPPARCSTLLAG